MKKTKHIREIKNRRPKTLARWRNEMWEMLDLVNELAESFRYKLLSIETERSILDENSRLNRELQNGLTANAALSSQYAQAHKDLQSAMEIINRHAMLGGKMRVQKDFIKGK